MRQTMRPRMTRNQKAGTKRTGRMRTQLRNSASVINSGRVSAISFHDALFFQSPHTGLPSDKNMIECQTVKRAMTTAP